MNSIISDQIHLILKLLLEPLELLGCEDSSDAFLRARLLDVALMMLRWR